MCADEVPYMTKALRKDITNRSRLENRYYRCRTDESKTAYKKQRNYCSRLYKKEMKNYYAKLDKKNALLIINCLGNHETIFFGQRCGKWWNYPSR